MISAQELITVAVYPDSRTDRPLKIEWDILSVTWCKSVTQFFQKVLKK